MQTDFISESATPKSKKEVQTSYDFELSQVQGQIFF
jgi:hypothetical protein